MKPNAGGDSSGSDCTPAELKRRLDARDPLFVLDVRAAGEFESWRIEAPPPVATLNLPYHRILAAAEDEDLVKAAAEYLSEHARDRLPSDRPIVVVCAKGGTSQFVAAGLRRLGYPAFSLRGGTKAWGDFYDARPVVGRPGLEVYQVCRPARGCLSYVVASRGEAVIVDPLRHPEPYEAIVRERGLRVLAVLDTHAHADHLSGGRILAARFGAPYGLHPYDAIHPMDALPATFEYEPLREGWTRGVGEIELEALHVPGHTLGCLAFRVEDCLLSGDTIFIGSIARPDLGGQAQAWTPLHQRSLRRLLELPGDTRVFPGHYASPAEVGAEGVFGAPLKQLRRANTGLRKAEGDGAAFARFILSSLPEFPPEYVEIKRANLGLANWTDERASELELGRNVCALSSQ